jgi:hypothetical protein
MTHDSFSAPGISSRQYPPHTEKIRRTSIFAPVIAALHDSRRLQARRILRQYQHLISPPNEARPHHPNTGGHEKCW